MHLTHDEIVAFPEVAAVLNGAACYDDLRTEAEQALAREICDARMKNARKSLNLEAEFLAAGKSWAEADADGRVVIRNA